MLLSAGAVIDEPPRSEAFGAETRLLDPEGNALLLVAPLQAEVQLMTNLDLRSCADCHPAVCPRPASGW